MNTDNGVATADNQSPNGIDRGGIKLALNGGSSVMERATIPIQWFFKPDVINKKPVELLIIEQSETEISHASRGERRAVKVTDTIAFMQVFSPGKHRVSAIAFKRKVPYELLVKEGRRYYDRYINTNGLVERFADGHLSGGPFMEVVGAAVYEFEVPKELFASAGESWLSTKIWGWTNEWYELPPRDECQYRARLITAFTLKPPVWLAARAFMLIFQILATICLPIARLILAFLGYKSTPYFEGIGRVWRWQYNPKDEDHVLIAHEWGDYRVLEKDRNGFTTKSRKFTGLELLLLAGAAWLYRQYVTWQMTLFLTAFFIVSGLIVFLFINRIYNMRIPESDRALLLAKQKQEAEEELEDKYLKWLQNLSSEQAPDRVDRKHLPTPFGATVFHKFRVNFWFAKMKICKPFAK